MKSIIFLSLVLVLLALFSIIDVSASPVQKSTPETIEPKSLIQELKVTRANIETQIKHLEQRLHAMAETLEQIDRLIDMLESGEVLKDAKLRFDGFYDRNGFVRTGTDYALLFATNDYRHWHNPTSPITDAETIGTELKNRYGFNVDIRRNLKTRSEILHAIAEYAQKDYETGDQLFVYFTGHGYFSETLNSGYIAAGDSQLPEVDPGMVNYLGYDELKGLLDRIACDRVMLTLDVCYGGTFDDNFSLPLAPLTRGSDDGPAVRGQIRKLDRKLDLQNTLKVKTRWYLSSSGTEEVLDGLPGMNSPFASALVSLLRNGAGEDGVLTIPEIERQLPVTYDAKLDEFEAAWKEKNPGWKGEIQQTPVSGPFGSGKASDKAFVFIAKDFVPLPPSRR